MGEGCSPEEGYSSKRQTSSEEESFKGSGMKHSIGTMDGAKANVHDSITQQFAIEMGQKHRLAIKRLIETGEETTFEDPSIIKPSEREKHFGQKDHLRVYGLDYPEILRKHGFEVEELSHSQIIEDEDPGRFRLDPRELLYLCRKQK